MGWRAVAVALCSAGCADPPLPQTEVPSPVTVVTTVGSACRGGVQVVLSGELSSDTSLSAGCVYVLEGTVTVGSSEDPATLFIEAGTRILGQPDSSLLVPPGSRIEAEGLPDRPIVFTSDQPEGSRGPGDWGGITVLGRAPVNGFGPTWASRLGSYGGTILDDDSGVLRYVRIEFAGLGEHPTLGALSLGGVGAGTVVDHVQLHRSHGIGAAVSGGTVDLGHLVVTGTFTASLLWWDGWRGRGQWMCLQSNSSGVVGGTSDDSIAEPQSHPRLANVTAVGRGPSSALWLGSRTGLFFSNSLVTNHQLCLVADTTVWLSDLDVRNSRFDCADPFVSDDPEVDLAAWVIEEQTGNRVADLADLADRSSSETAPDFSSSLVGGGVAADDFLQATNAQGCMSADDDWTVGWTDYPVD
ncbi:MAG: hypothetical protein KTR31_28915 [Myxococcales bacterium]|nr:hypothetical protein [Myxococcales bacterium]